MFLPLSGKASTFFLNAPDCLYRGFPSILSAAEASSSSSFWRASLLIFCISSSLSETHCLIYSRIESVSFQAACAAASPKTASRYHSKPTRWSFKANSTASTITGTSFSGTPDSRRYFPIRADCISRRRPSMRVLASSSIRSAFLYLICPSVNFLSTSGSCVPSFSISSSVRTQEYFSESRLTAFRSSRSSRCIWSSFKPISRK